MFMTMLNAELRLMLKGLSKWWYLLTLGLVIASAFSPLDVVREYLLPFCWIVPVLLWSSMGTREIRNRTDQIVFSSAHLFSRQLPAVWMGGVILSVLLGFGAGAQFIIRGDWLSLFAWGVAALFIPSLALALGVWSNSSKLFEVLYTILWYIGPINKISGADYIGTTAKSLNAGTVTEYFFFTVVLLLLAVVGRKRQVGLR
jgi:hypothetical protein